MKRTRNQAGFTLVEIAIVLVIVGLLLGAVLKGQELIFNSKVKSTFNMSRELTVAMASYQDRYRMLPGDDNQATTRFPSATPAVTNGNADGFLNQVANWNCSATQQGDNCRFVHHLRASGFIAGSGSDNLRHAFGGPIDVAQGNLFITNGNAMPAMNLRGSSLTVKAASAIDTAFDDGNPAAGTFRCQTITTYDMTNPDNLLANNCVVPL